MNYNRIRRMDVSNGPGIRVSLFTQGCNLHCKGCFNKEAWDYSQGKEFTLDTVEDIITLCEQPFIEGLSILGGEPFSPQNASMLFELASAFKHEYPHKTIWIWSGHLYENLIQHPEYKAILDICDVLVDGPFVESLRNDKLLYRGSSNQRVINLKEQ